VQPDYHQGYAQPPQQYGQPDYGQGYGAPGGYQQAPADVQAVLSVDDGSQRTYQLQRGSNILGRGQDASFRLPDTSVSRRHVDIYFDGQVAVMHDLGSTNGTSVNGATVQTWQLADGDVIRVGHSTVVFNTHR
jgi:pSer/pThr/pTyr-binding forkhead associated (FHA) protein